jgi:hypothetical protein
MIAKDGEEVYIHSRHIATDIVDGVGYHFFQRGP